MSRQLVIAGMHRSGTSLLANIAARAGVDMGSSLMGKSKGNRHGHFEDLELVHLQETWLESRGWSALVPPPEGAVQLTSSEEDEARSLVARRADKPLWGFKDPRTALFLPVWDRLLPDPLYLLVYRHPIEVALSLLRRGLDVEVQLNPWVAVQAWTVYNAHLLRFRLDHPERCLLWHVEGATRALGPAFAALAGKLGVAFSPDAVGAFAPEDLTGGLWARGIDWRAIMPEAMDLYSRLQAAADIPSGDETAATAGRSPLERDLLETAEHLLAATLSSARPASEAQIPAARRVDYSDLRLHMARQEEEVRRLSGQLGLRDLEIRRLLEEAQRNERRTRSLTGRARALEEQLGSREEEWGRVQATRGWKLLQGWWSLASRRRALRRADADNHPRVDEVLIGCVAENNPRFIGESLRLVQSIRWFGGAMADVRVMVCFVDGVDPQARRELERYGAEVRVVPRFDPRNASANKLELFAPALETGAGFLVLLDCDMVVTRDLLPLLDRRFMQSKVVDVPSVTHEAFVPLFRHFGLPLPPRSMRTTLLDTPTIPYCNTAMVALPADLARRFVPVWRDYNRRILDVLDLMGPCAHHCHQASFSLALAACPVPLRELTADLNFPLHLTHLEPPPEFLAADPAILHYHKEIDADGYLVPSPYPLAQARIEAWNKRLRREREASPPPAPGAGVRAEV
ncbi:MAG TPA: hypothetical protein VMW27_01005 [Thermoanaerobaculia bacterium]|nr:hypothetical protein [Thermoanaerobaculia bacterium]